MNADNEAAKSSHPLDLRSQDADFIANELFSNSAPLEIEVGTGKGLFLINEVEQNPDHNFIGIEISLKYAELVAARFDEMNASNAIMIRGDAQKLLHEHVRPESIAAVHVYFPDPWWKKRHRKRRVLNEQFVKDIERVLLPEGVLHFWTDVLEYYESTLELIAESTSLGDFEPVEERPSEHDFDYLTHYERRMRKRDLPVYRSRFTKRVS
ncbi:MAG: tRNA (guanosine(46)-N7)-methyltransferase TrmB [bacterium]|nr:tRNA (guanosine(46)-N7)-methyltransferase TrmB [bacterium]